jgi:hypothetical protein
VKLRRPTEAGRILVVADMLGQAQFLIFGACFGKGGLETTNFVVLDYEEMT